MTSPAPSSPPVLSKLLAAAWKTFYTALVRMESAYVSEEARLSPDTHETLSFKRKAWVCSVLGLGLTVTPAWIVSAQWASTHAQDNRLLPMMLLLGVFVVCGGVFLFRRPLRASLKEPLSLPAALCAALIALSIFGIGCVLTYADVIKPLLVWTFGSILGGWMLTIAWCLQGSAVTRSFRHQKDQRMMLMLAFLYQMLAWPGWFWFFKQPKGWSEATFPYTVEATLLFFLALSAGFLWYALCFLHTLSVTPAVALCAPSHRERGRVGRAPLLLLGITVLLGWLNLVLLALGSLSHETDHNDLVSGGKGILFPSPSSLHTLVFHDETLHAQVKGEGASSLQYWREYVLSSLSDYGTMVIAEVDTQAPHLQAPFFPRTLQQTPLFHIENARPFPDNEAAPHLAPENPVSWSAPIFFQPSFGGGMWSLKTRHHPPTINPEGFIVTPWRAAFEPPFELLATDEIYRAHHLAVPHGPLHFARLAAWADTQRPAGTVDEQIAWLSAFFDEHFSYSYRIMPSDASAPLDSFFFTERAGICAQFALTTAIILRIWKIPSRVVTGYRTAEVDDKGTVFLRGKHRHAWVEVLHPVRKRWERLDTTSSRVIDTPYPLTFWQRLVLLQKQRSAEKVLTERRAALTENEPERDTLLSPSSFLLAFLVLALLCLLLFLRWKRTRLHRTPEDLWRDYQAWCAHVGHPKHVGESAHQWGERLRSETLLPSEAWTLAGAYHAHLYQWAWTSSVTQAWSNRFKRWQETKSV